MILTVCSESGYFVIAFDKDDETKPIGTFQSPSDGKLINCTSNAMVSDIPQNNYEKQNLLKQFKLRTLPRIHLKKTNN